MLERLSIYCPHCRRYASLRPAPVELVRGEAHYTGEAIWRDDNGDDWWIGVCNYCQRAVLVLDEGRRIYPQALPTPTDERIPEAIRSDLEEAKLCDSVGAWRGCAVMARRAIQSAAIDKGAAGGKLADQVADLASRGAITQDLKEWADVVRWVGNDAAHPNGEPVTTQDAEDVLQLAEQFLHVLYVAPAIAKARRDARGR